MSDRDFVDELIEERTARDPQFPRLLAAAERAVASEVAALRAEIGRLRQEVAYHNDYLAQNACPLCDEPLRWGEYGSDGIVCTCCDRPFQHCRASRSRP